MCSNNHSNNNYMRFVGKWLFFTFFLIAIPLFPSQAPDFINQTIFNKFWELVHLMFIGIAVSYGLFCRRRVDNGNLDDSQSSFSGMFQCSSIFEDGFRNSMYCSGQSNAGSFYVKNGNFENPCEENVVQAWSSKYFQGEPMVVLAKPNSSVDYKSLGLPVRSLRSRVASRASPEFGNGSSESSGSHMKNSLDSSDKGRSGGFGESGSENLEGKLSQSDVLGSPIPWRSRSGKMRERVHSNVARSSHFRPLSVDETQFESLKLQSLRSTISLSSQVSSESPSPISMSPLHSSSSESPKYKVSELVKERSPRRSFPPTSSSLKPTSGKASVNLSYSQKENDETQFESLKSHSLRSTGSFSSQVSSQSLSPTSMSPSHSSYVESPKYKASELVKESSLRQSFPPTSPSVPKPTSSKASVNASHSWQDSGETQFESLKPWSFRSTVSLASQGSSRSPSPTRMSLSHSGPSESPKYEVSELVKERSPRQSFPPTSPSVPKPMSSKALVNASHSRQYSDGSVLGTAARKCFENELKEFCDSKKDRSSDSKQWVSSSFKFDAKPAAPCKASLRGKSVRTFRSFRASVNTMVARNGREKHEDYTKGKLTMGSDEIEKAYMGESEPKVENHNNLFIGVNLLNLGVESHVPKPISPKSQKREIQDYPKNPAAEPGEDSEREDGDSQESSDEETMSGAFSLAGSEVDRKAGEFIAKFREQIRLQRTTSIDTPRGVNITSNIFR